MRVAEINKVVQEILGIYVSLEEYYMIQNVQKAIKIDEHACVFLAVLA